MYHTAYCDPLVLQTSRLPSQHERQVAALLQSLSSRPGPHPVVWGGEGRGSSMLLLPGQWLPGHMGLETALPFPPGSWRGFCWHTGCGNRIFPLPFHLRGWQGLLQHAEDQRAHFTSRTIFLQITPEVSATNNLT